MVSQSAAALACPPPRWLLVGLGWVSDAGSASSRRGLFSLAQLYRVFFKVLYSPVVYDRFLYDLTVHIALQIKSLVEGALVFAHGRQDPLQTGLAMTAVRRME